jgi:hypothetical protein
LFSKSQREFIVYQQEEQGPCHATNKLMCLMFTATLQFPSIRDGPVLIAKLFRDGTVSAERNDLVMRRCKFGFFLDLIMMEKIGRQENSKT